MKSLGDFITDRTESLDEKGIKEFFVDYRKAELNRLLDSEQYLLEGSRGVGKTMLMKYAALKTEEKFEEDSVLGVWISFEESIRIERIKIVNNDNDPFLQWTMGKILLEVLLKLKSLKPSHLDDLANSLSSIFGSTESEDGYLKYFSILEKYIDILEKGDIVDNSELNETISIDLIRILDNPYAFKKFLLELIEDFSISRLVLLFDEAAHVFSNEQQEKFFTFFKSLRDPKIACKASVYPGVTNYGMSFEKGQDAKEIEISWSFSSKKDIKYIKDILKIRIQAYNKKYWELLTVDSNIIDLICVCSNGNPRFAFHIIDALEMAHHLKESSKRITLQQLVSAVRVVIETKWKEFATLKNRLLKYNVQIDVADKLIKQYLISNLKEWNNKRKVRESIKLSAGFYVETSLFGELAKVFEILAYSNLVSIDHKKKSIGQGFYGFYITFNPSLVLVDNIFQSVANFDNVSIAIENNQAYYPTTSYMNDIVQTLKITSEKNCSNTKCNFVTEDESFIFCPKCGNSMEKDDMQDESLYKIMRSHSVDNLRLSDKIINRVKSKFNNIGEIYDAELSDIQEISYIKEVRSAMVKTSAIEYMAG